MNFIEKYWKFHQTFLYKLLSVVLQSEKWKDLMNRNSQFQNAIQIARHILRNFWRSYSNGTLLSVRSTQLHTRSIWLTQMISDQIFLNYIPHRSSIILNFIAPLSGNASYYINTTALLTLSV